MKSVIIIILAFLYATSASAGTVRDDFSDGDFEGWLPPLNPFLPHQVEWRVEYGKLRGTAKDDSANTHPIFLVFRGVDSIWTNLTVTFNFSIVDERPNGEAGKVGIILRDTGFFGSLIQKELGVGRIFFEVDYHNNIAYAGKVFYEPWKYVNAVKVPFPIDKNRWYKMKTMAHGEHCDFYINNDHVGEFDAPEWIGAVALYFSNGIVQFDDFVMAGPNVPNKYLSIQPALKLTATWGNIKLK
jgi:hypothetical protein